MATIPHLHLLPKEERRIVRGHLWVYRNELQPLPEIADGAVVDVFADSGRFVGRGFFQQEGGIAVRILSWRQQDIGAEFFKRRLEAAADLRHAYFPGSPVYRWVFGESDGLPGLVLDRYGDVVVAQTSCAFYEEHAATLLESTELMRDVRSIFWRGAKGSRWHGPEVASQELELEGFRLHLRPDNAQKTGLFLDQRLNRKAIEPLCAGLRVLDGHCHHGLWACHAARAGAVEVLGVDTSQDAIDQAWENVLLNGLEDRCAFECSTVERVLERGDRYGMVIIDPPAFAKSRGQLKGAFARYAGLNVLAIKGVEPGGYLVTSSCSHFLDAPTFMEMLKQAVSKAGRRATLLETRGAGPDHPALLAMPETSYLKCAILKIH